MKWLVLVAGLGLAGCTGTPLDRMVSASNDMVAAVNEGQVAQCKLQADQATALGKVLDPRSLTFPSTEVQTLQQLLQRFMGG